MRGKLIEMAIGMFIRMLTPDLLKQFVGMVLDFIEQSVKGTASEVDDKLVLPLVDILRQTFEIE